MYKISNRGRLYSCRSSIIMKPNEIKGGYLQYNISVNGKRHGRLEHRLVALAFLPSIVNFPEVNHIDGNKHNNCVDNLEWIDRLGNIRHAFKIGSMDSRNFKGDRNPNAKLSNEQRDKIITDTRTLKEIAADYGVTDAAICYVKKTWKVGA